MTTKPLQRLPHRFDGPALVEVMAAIGLPLPDGAKQRASDGKRLWAAGVRFEEALIDEALAKTELTIGDRFAVKIAISNAGMRVGR